MSSTETIFECFRDTARRCADQPLVVTPDASHSFAEIDGQSDRVAAALAAHGVEPGDRMGLYCPNSVEFVVAYLGIVKAGACVVPINLLIQPGEIRYVLDDASVRGVMFHAVLQEKVDAVKQLLPGDLCWIGIGVEQEYGDVVPFSRLLEVSAPAPETSLDAARDLAALLYTSGTTGRPKGAMLTHGNLVANTSSVVRALALRPGEDRVLVVLPMFHSFAATVGLLTPALHGLSLVPVARFDPKLISESIGQTQATVFLGVPSLYGLIQRIDDQLLAHWGSVRFGVAGGAAMPVDLLQRFEGRFGFPLLEGDGPTECSPVTCVNPPDGPRKPGSVGLAVPDVEIRICDEAGGRLAAGEVGEICVRGPNVMKGYWGQSAATDEVFFGEWFRTGDLGYLDDDDYVFMVDRKKDLVIVNGMNVYPRMVEEVLYRYPGIAEAAVVGEPHPSHGEIVVAYVVAKPGQWLDEKDMRQFCRQRLGQHQMPRRFELRDDLPKNATGKVLKRELRRAGEIERGVQAD